MSLSGIKTYLAAIAAVLVSIIAWLADAQSIAIVLEVIGLAVALAATRFNVKEIEWLSKLAELDEERIQRLIATVLPYLSAALVIVTALLAYITGEQSLFVAVQAILGALGTVFLNRGVNKAETAAVSTLVHGRVPT